MITKGVYKKGIPIRHISETAIAIERITNWEQVKNDMSWISQSAPKGLSKDERQVFIIEVLLDTGPKKVQLLIEKFPYRFWSIVKSFFSFSFFNLNLIIVLS